MKNDLLDLGFGTGRTVLPATERPIEIATATDEDRDLIFRARHDVYGLELSQHAANGDGRLCDSLDDFNIYLVAKVDGHLAGFISITPPGKLSYSIDKYFDRAALPITFDARLYEIRLLTVLRKHRGRELASLLMYAAFRWIESHGGQHIVAIGRREILDLYSRAGLQQVGCSVKSGAVHYELLHATTEAVRAKLIDFDPLLCRIEKKLDWRFHFPFFKPAACFHGGAFFKAIGEKFDRLDRTRSIINADVLDAWFPPSPRVVAALANHLPWLLKTSPPTACEGLIETIAQARGVAPENILPGAGSSDLIFRAFREWLTPESRALILDPTYGEYAHVLERVIDCRVNRFLLSKARNYEVNLAELERALAREYDLVVLVNPNSPTGQHIPRAPLVETLSRAPACTRVWIDETYIEYAGPDQTLEKFATQTENVIVCKSMSKVYALSGARVAYLCAAPHQLEQLRAVTPPWVVSLPAQVAAVNALQDPGYYIKRHWRTKELREQLATELRALGLEVLPGIANFLLCELPAEGPNASAVVHECRKRGLFLRDAKLMGSRMGTHSIRIAVKGATTNQKTIRILREVLEALKS